MACFLCFFFFLFSRIRRWYFGPFGGSCAKAKKFLARFSFRGLLFGCLMYVAPKIGVGKLQTQTTRNIATNTVRCLLTIGSYHSRYVFFISLFPINCAISLTSPVFIPFVHFSRIV
ncbi:hypothetical protein BDV37DRAFT_96829 [Aspergillus pseudonomiae]|uniref:Uncharacterized protein n=1 Tax=Aspergillus pseudonomiae TaxID=1506151 RepID=A0A5N7CRR3_9EURO|nr:uncharacterized protein BDV37DRAFT_96829 [Aspergillus pseudonomiae]KAE8396814.1 hypothetical protein BDV37DRAFT_96829 [Aspergillus pseudonomiae]